MIREMEAPSSEAIDTSARQNLRIAHKNGLPAGGRLPVPYCTTSMKVVL